MRRGRRKLVAVSELERWLDRNAEATTAAATARRANPAAASASAPRDRRVATSGVRLAGVPRSEPTTPANGARDG